MILLLRRIHFILYFADQWEEHNCGIRCFVSFPFQFQVTFVSCPCLVFSLQKKIMYYEVDTIGCWCWYVCLKISRHSKRQMILHDKLEHYINHPLPPSSQHNVCRYSVQTSLFTLLINPGPLISAAYANIDSDPPNMQPH